MGWQVSHFVNAVKDIFGGKVLTAWEGVEFVEFREGFLGGLKDLLSTDSQAALTTTTNQCTHCELWLLSTPETGTDLSLPDLAMVTLSLLRF